ncbi:hypothetical protein scyTo_0023104, partial [Scyliorhinus torazame]|nr:hypothetical protein [Scyliorhinus torazame]
GIHRQKLFRWDVCDEDFTHSFNLLRNDEKPFGCEVCDKSFTQSAYPSKTRSLNQGVFP